MLLFCLGASEWRLGGVLFSWEMFEKKCIFRIDVLSFNCSRLVCCINAFCPHIARNYIDYNFVSRHLLDRLLSVGGRNDW